MTATNTTTSTPATDFTLADVAAFWDFMMGRYGGTVLPKGDSALMKAAGAVLEAAGIQKRTDFLTHYTTTTFGCVFVPFTVGLPTPDASLLDQVAVATHECVHLTQERTLGLRYRLRYLASPTERAAFETEAYTATAEIYFWRTGAVPRPLELARELIAYACRPQDVATAVASLELACETIVRGGIITEPGRTAIAWLDAHLSHLRTQRPPTP